MLHLCTLTFVNAIMSGGKNVLQSRTPYEETKTERRRKENLIFIYKVRGTGAQELMNLILVLKSIRKLKRQ